MVSAAPRLQQFAFLPADAYRSAAVAERERQRYAPRFWHPVAPLSELPPGTSLALEMLELPVLLTHPPGEAPRAFVNRCPHRGVALQRSEAAARPCRRLVCPYHGWTYDLHGSLLAAAREAEFLEPFERRAWPLQPLACAVRGSMLWLAIGPDPVPIDAQLDLVLSEAGPRFAEPRALLASHSLELACNWKIAHDNTLDDYHVAIAHPTTLHREQGPVHAYRHVLGGHANLLATPYRGEPGDPADRAGAPEFLTFGLPPATHLLLWPDGRMAVLHFQPLTPERCRQQLWLLGDPASCHLAGGWLAEMLGFLEEDRALVEAAQRGYRSGLTPGPAHRLEQRILHQQAIYRACVGEAAESG